MNCCGVLVQNNKSIYFDELINWKNDMLSWPIEPDVSEWMGVMTGRYIKLLTSDLNQLWASQAFKSGVKINWKKGVMANKLFIKYYKSNIALVTLRAFEATYSRKPYTMTIFIFNVHSD